MGRWYSSYGYLHMPSNSKVEGIQRCPTSCHLYCLFFSHCSLFKTSFALPLISAVWVKIRIWWPQSSHNTGLSYKQMKAMSQMFQDKSKKALTGRMICRQRMKVAENIEYTSPRSVSLVHPILKPPLPTQCLHKENSYLNYRTSNLCSDLLS